MMSIYDDVYVAGGKKFDISEFKSSMHQAYEPCIHSICDDELGVDGLVNREWAIAIAKHFNLTAEDLK